MALKVLHVINSLATGGAEKLLVEALPRFLEQDVQVDLLLLDGARTSFYKELEKKFTGNIISLSGHSTYNPLHIIRLRAYLKNYDLIHVHLFPALYWVAISKFLFNIKVPLFFTEHSTNNTRIDNPVFRIVDRLIYGLYKRISAISPQVKEQLVDKLKLKEAQCVVITNGIDLIKLRDASGYAKGQFFDSEAIILIQVSSFQAAKDQQTVIKALSLLPKALKLLLVGEGKLKAECEQLVDKLGLGERVIFLGARTDVPNLLKTADIVVQSSNWEGFGLAAVEGMAASKPVIVSGVAGLQDVVADAGLIFKQGDQEDLAKQINLLLADNELFKTVADNCYRRAKSYGIEVMIDSFVLNYRTITGAA